MNRILTLVVLVVTIILNGCGQETGEAATVTPIPFPKEAGLNVQRDYYGARTTEETILLSDTIVRAELLGMGTSTASISVGGNTSWSSLLEFRFRAHEYLKGSGPNEIIASSMGDYHDTEAEALAQLPSLVAFHDTRWDDRQAILFLNSVSPELPSTQAADRFMMSGLAIFFGEDAYTVASRHIKSWLPAAAPPGADADSTRSTDSGTSDPLFLLGAPSHASEGAAGDSARPGVRSSAATTTTAPTISLSAMKKLIADVEAEANAGGTDLYRECVVLAYRQERRYSYLQNEGRRVKAIDEDPIASGQPAGTIIFEFPSGAPAQDDIGRHWFEGRDKDTFRFEAVDFKPSPENPESGHLWYTALIVTTRPLPAGNYRFYYNSRSSFETLCNSLSPLELNTRDSRLTVTRSTDVPGIQHEAFFDPVDIGTAVGADTSNGVLEPNAFSLDTTTTTISSLKWQDGAVSMTLSPTASLADYAIDFIDVNGTTTLSLTSANASTTPLAWTVPDKPWSDGDLLMLRIHKPVSNDATLSALALSGVDLAFSTATTTYTASVPATTTQTTVTPTTNHASATYVVKLAGVADLDGTIPLAAGDNVITVDVTAEDATTTKTYTVTITRATPPEPVTVTLTPRTEGLTFFDLTVQWNDTQTCDNRYFVTVRRNDGYIVRNMGFHPAETTSATLVTYWPMDNVPDFVAVVECDPSSGPRREVGRMSLRSAQN